MIGIAPTNPQLDLYAQPGRYFGVNLTAKMVVPAALSAERLPAPSTRGPRVSMALSLALHGLADRSPSARRHVRQQRQRRRAGAHGRAVAARRPPPGPRPKPTKPEPTPEPQQQPEPPTPPRRDGRGDAAARAASRPPRLRRSAAAARSPRSRSSCRRRTNRRRSTAAEMKPVEPPKPKPPQPPKPAAAPRPTAQARRHQGCLAPDTGNASSHPAAGRRIAGASIVLEGKPRYRVAADAGRLSAALHRAQPAGRGSGARAPRSRRHGRRDPAVAQQRLRRCSTAPRSPPCAAGTSFPPCATAAPSPPGSKFPFVFIFVGKETACSRPRTPISPPAGATCATRSPRCASAMPPRRSASARPSWWRWASARPRRRSTADWRGILNDMPAVGRVMCLTRNEHCVHERHGRFEDVQVTRPARPRARSRHRPAPVPRPVEATASPCANR